MSQNQSKIYNQIELAVSQIEDLEDLKAALTAFSEALEPKTEQSDFPNSIFLYKTIRHQVAIAIDTLSLYCLAKENVQTPQLKPQSKTKKTKLPTELSDYENQILNYLV